MSDPLGPPSPQAATPGLWTGDFCESCPLEQLCGAGGTPDACGHPGEYLPGVAHPVDLGPDAAAEFALPPVCWPPVPELAPAVGVVDRLLAGRHVGIRLPAARRASTWASPPPDATGLAVLVGADKQLEFFWQRSHALARALADWGVPVVLAPGYSTWWEDPPAESLLSMARSAAVARILARHVPTIPCVVWRTGRDLSRWAEWLTTTRPSAVAVDLQTLRSEAGWAWAMAGIERLAELLVCPLPRLVANGPSTLARVRAVGTAWAGPVTILSQNPWQKAISGQRLAADLSDRPAAAAVTTDELLAANLGTFEGVVAAVLEAVPAARAVPGSA